MRADAASRAEPDAEAEALRLERLVRDAWGIEGLALAARYRRRRLAALRKQLCARERGGGREVPSAEFVALRARVAVLEQIERAERGLALELLARRIRADRRRQAPRSGWPARRGHQTTMMA